jgi:hypothetical protein
VFWKKLERPDEGEDWSKIRVGERVAAVVRRIAEVEGSMSKGTRAAAQGGRASGRELMNVGAKRCHSQQEASDSPENSVGWMEAEHLQRRPIERRGCKYTASYVANVRLLGIQQESP